jgi:peptidoglycan/LPS O-acetylase OafA/YrhL
MQNCPIQRLALALLMLVSLACVVVAAVAAWGLDFTGWIALAALGLSAVLVAAGRRLHEAWQAARWDAGQRLR